MGNRGGLCSLPSPGHSAPGLVQVNPLPRSLLNLHSKHALAHRIYPPTHQLNSARTQDELACAIVVAVAPVDPGTRAASRVLGGSLLAGLASAELVAAYLAAARSSVTGSAAWSAAAARWLPFPLLAGSARGGALSSLVAAFGRRLAGAGASLATTAFSALGSSGMKLPPSSDGSGGGVDGTLSDTLALLWGATLGPVLVAFQGQEASLALGCALLGAGVWCVGVSARRHLSPLGWWEDPALQGGRRLPAHR